MKYDECVQNELILTTVSWRFIYNILAKNGLDWTGQKEIKN